MAEQKHKPRRDRSKAKYKGCHHPGYRKDSDGKLVCRKCGKEPGLKKGDKSPYYKKKVTRNKSNASKKMPPKGGRNR